MSWSKLRDNCHCPSFAKARIVELKLIRSGKTLKSYIDWKTPRAMSHRASFSQALMAEVQLITSGHTWQGGRVAVAKRDHAAARND